MSSYVRGGGKELCRKEENDKSVKEKDWKRSITNKDHHLPFLLPLHEKQRLEWIYSYLVYQLSPEEV